jgi:hypothetical protein
LRTILTNSFSQGIEKIRSELERSDSLRKAAASKEKDSLERLQSQIQAEQKLKAGPHFFQLTAYPNFKSGGLLLKS